MMNKILIVLAALVMATAACKKSDFLDEKPDIKLVVPKTLKDFQAILDNDREINGIPGGQGLVPHLGETGADNYFLLDATFNAISNPLYRNYYLWAKDVNTSNPVPDWNRPYLSIFYTNVVLDGLKTLTAGEQDTEAFRKVKGSALFYRAHAFYQLAQVFAPPYNESTASAMWGIPLRSTADVGEKLSRATLLETYTRILADLQTAKGLLTIDNIIKERPSKQAAFGLLSRTCLAMMQYEKAYLYADSCLQLKSSLSDYNNLNPDAFYSFAGSDVKAQEVIFSSIMIGPDLQIPVNIFQAKADPDLYASYADDDLRKVIFFAPGFPSGNRFKGSYLGMDNLFAGITTDEVLLIRAEAAARTNRVQIAKDDINRLLVKRWKKGKVYPVFSSLDAEETLNFVLKERRKELVFRGLRWTDIRRLNLEGRNISIRRTISGTTYELKPNDMNYTYPIPLQVTGFNPDMPQNPRAGQ
ncbi:RagB/SusD family nutrient uptake outer membrane protein [Pedobacter hiemivivus]|uniref:RagB/SusD family nutrient uptake outer membrane protein n=1 Tax=Pedobacter hiemivivus TaxID=2530454 RepID=A0A4R0NEF8_9SPHI|nr:RagB/SusD family nutrient uptake outer membrane protein [Pedobacter hiemivivus]TCC98821.1 RagB/SusD family nutrient uptake outer membrane protein [Pedobacter hiemivivus]